MTRILKAVGKPVLKSIASIQETLSFAGVVIHKIFTRGSYNSATRMVLVNQIYFTAVQILPLFITVSIIFGSLLIGIVFTLIKEFGLAEYLGSILMGFVVTELAPFITVLLIALRSSSAINATSFSTAFCASGVEHPRPVQHQCARLPVRPAHHQRDGLRRAAELPVLHPRPGERHAVFLAHLRDGARHVRKYLVKFCEVF
jgi:hypothetical protein